MYDWSKEVDTTDPEYYKWTQWIFLQLLKRGLAYESNLPINWCPSCMTGLANEEASGGQCERCGSAVEQKPLRQWVLKITEYADKLHDDLDQLTWPEHVKLIQKNWIGRSEGLVFSAPVKDMDLTIQTFSAHFEAFAADRFVVIAPDHELLPKLIEGIKNKQEILDFCKKILDERAANRNTEEKEVSGIFTGRYIQDPVSKKDLPIWVASFALAHYGTGIVKCSAHDERDFAFAKKYNIPLVPVLFPTDPIEAEKVRNLEYCYTDMKEGILQAPAAFAGRRSGDCRQEIIEYCKQQGYATTKKAYKIRDWIFSRQRYWGEPIPVIHCNDCGAVPVPESELPVRLPEVKEYQPTGTGESPLAAIESWVNTNCPSCKKPAKRETNTMPQWAGSCWYFLRYPNPNLTTAAFNAEDMNYWMPIDFYVGGIEHAVLHLLYSRFWIKVLHDAGHLPFNEPFTELFNQGKVCMKSEKSGRVEKMSKSKGNVVNPDDIVQTLGSDTLRMYMLFMGPPDQDVEWQTEAIMGVRNFLSRLWHFIITPENRLPQGQKSDDATIKRFHRFLKDFQERLNEYKVNTAVATVMEYLNDLTSKKMKLDTQIVQDFLCSISVMVPHFASELLEQTESASLADCKWPTFDAELAKVTEVGIAIQVNGKLRGTIQTERGRGQTDICPEAEAIVAQWLAGNKIVKVIFVQDRLINFVVQPV